MERREPEVSDMLVALRKLAAEGFDAIDRGEVATIDGHEQLGAFIAGIGKRVARRVDRRSGAK
jgi:hypothetical protein